MARSRITLEGGDELLRQLRRIDESMQGATLTQATADGADVLVQGMRVVAPRGESGILASDKGIGMEQSIKDTKVAEFEIGPTKRAFYGVFQELGTIWMSANPFMRPAYDTEKPNVVKAIGDTLRKALEAIRGIR